MRGQFLIRFFHLEISARDVCLYLTAKTAGQRLPYCAHGGMNHPITWRPVVVVVVVAGVAALYV